MVEGGLTHTLLSSFGIGPGGRLKSAKGPCRTAGEVRARADGLAEARGDRWIKSPDFIILKEL